jgi:hypothetical protein
MGFDTVPKTELVRGNAVSLVLNSGGEKELKAAIKNYQQAGRKGILTEKLLGCSIWWPYR